MSVGEFTLIVPYYRNVEMLREQIRHWEKYPEQVRVVVVDDGSPEPAEDLLMEASPMLLQRLRLFRIDVDIPWNRGGARNLGSRVADTEWIMHIDIDHVLPADQARALLNFEANPKRWYRFERFRIGQADETRRKDKIDPQADYGKIHPHVDSYLCRKRLYWEAGGYDEDYSGCLGGGTPFLAVLERRAPVEVAPANVFLQVYTRTKIKDASDWALSRDTTEFSSRRRAKIIASGGKKDLEGQNPLRFPYHEVLMRYPNVRGEYDTLEQLLQGKSIARFGDGEMKLICGGAQIREPANRELGRELHQILQYPDPSCIVGIPTMDPAGPKYDSWRRHANRMARLVNPKQQYYSAFISRPDSAPWIENREFAEKMVSLWQTKRVAYVCEFTSKFYTLVHSTATAPAHWIACPHKETYAQSEDIMRKIIAFRPEVALLSCGPAATVMAHKLSVLGIQALDLGSMGGFILRARGLDDDEELESEP